MTEYGTYWELFGSPRVTAGTTDNLAKAKGLFDEQTLDYTECIYNLQYKVTWQQSWQNPTAHTCQFQVRGQYVR